MESEDRGLSTKLYLLIQLICLSLMFCTVYVINSKFNLNNPVFWYIVTLILTFGIVHNMLLNFIYDEEEDYFNEMLNQGFYLSQFERDVLEMYSGILLGKDGKPYTGNAFGPDKKLRNYRKGVLVKGIGGFLLKWWYDTNDVDEIHQDV